MACRTIGVVFSAVSSVEPGDKQAGGQGQGGPRSTVSTVSQIQEKFPDEYKAAQALRQSDPAAYRAKMRDLQQKLTAGN